MLSILSLKIQWIYIIAPISGNVALTLIIPGLLDGIFFRHGISDDSFVLKILIRDWPKACQVCRFLCNENDYPEILFHPLSSIPREYIPMASTSPGGGILLFFFWKYKENEEPYVLMSRSIKISRYVVYINDTIINDTLIPLTLVVRDDYIHFGATLLVG